MLKAREELYYQWDFEKNDKLDLDIHRVTLGSHKVAWWKCPDCNSKYDMKINQRAMRGYDCPFCSGNRVNETNSLANLYPEIAIEWHPFKNADLKPCDVTHRSNKKVWWLGACGHEWETYISHRTGKRMGGCPYCSNKRLLIGFNDMWSTNPDLAKLLLKSEDGRRYMQSSSKLVDWRCPDCRNIIKGKSPHKVNARGLSCVKCSDGISFGKNVYTIF